MDANLKKGFTIGDWVVKPPEGTVARANRKIHVEPKVMDVLVYLAERGGDVVSRGQLIDALWGHSFGADEALTRCISSLRQHLGEDRKTPRFIGTVPKRGYRLIAPVQPLKASTPATGIPAAGVTYRRRWPLPAAALAVILALGLAWWSSQTLWNVPRPPTVAVLPFVNMSPDENAEYFSDGLTEELITTLSKVRGLRVVARTSAFYFKGKDEDVRSIGRKLNVDSVLEGSVRKDGDQLRITAQLVDVTSGFHVWTERYDRKLQDVFEIQDDISRSVVKALKVALGAGQQQKLAKPPTDNLKAYESYLRGRYFLVGTPRKMKKGLNYLEQAVEESPDFAVAYAAIAESYTMQAFLTNADRAQALPKAKAAIARALALDSRLGEAHAVSGVVKFYFDWDWQGAETALRQALELNPGNADTYWRYSYYLLAMGRGEEAITASRTAQQLDPLSALATHWLAVAYLWMGDYEAAVREFRRALEFQPNWQWGRVKLGLTYSYMGKAAEALAEAAEAEKLAGGIGSPLFRSWLAQLYARAGRTDLARDALNQLQKIAQTKHVSPVALATASAALFEHDQVLDYLEKGYAEREPAMALLAAYWFFDEVRDHPRYRALLKKMNLLLADRRYREK